MTAERAPFWTKCAVAIAAVAMLVTLLNFGALAVGDKREIETRLVALEKSDAMQSAAIKQLTDTLSAMNGTLCALKAVMDRVEAQVTRHMENTKTSMMLGPQDTGRP